VPNETSSKENQLKLFHANETNVNEEALRFLLSFLSVKWPKQDDDE
jgi:hypothetical protein